MSSTQNKMLHTKIPLSSSPHLSDSSADCCYKINVSCFWGRAPCAVFELNANAKSSFLFISSEFVCTHTDKGSRQLYIKEEKKNHKSKWQKINTLALFLKKQNIYMVLYIEEKYRFILPRSVKVETTIIRIITEINKRLLGVNEYTLQSLF